MEPNMIAIIVLLSLLGCAIIGVVVYLIITFTKKDGSNKKCLNGCKYKEDSGNCGKPPCKKGKCPYTCAELRIGHKGWCQYDKYMDGDPKVDCTGCGCK